MKGSMSMSIKTICYLSFGYPTIEKSIEMAGRYIEGGCDAIEVSIPPKDPYRDSAFCRSSTALRWHRPMTIRSILRALAA